MARIMAAAVLILFATAPAWSGDACLEAGADGAIAEGKLTSTRGAFILELREPICLSGSEDFDSVDPTGEVHVFATEDGPQEALESLVGSQVRVTGRMFGAMTQHHKAPIIMEVIEAAAQ